MKGGNRAQAPFSPDSADDWGDESWTVDCPCGVNFDDGEEMVDCDECGVWVHTSCCRVLKGHTSYVCDKCKSKKKNESEETEVAQLLLDLPSKTLAFEEKSSEKTELCPMPFRSPAERSMEERAHVQGIPGGDASITMGISTVFSRQLWKCTGYIPKMLRFAYNELPELPGERITACSFFTDTCGRQTDYPASDGLRNDSILKAEDERRLEKDVEHQIYTFAEDQHANKEKRGKREGRKAESKHGSHRHRLHGVEERDHFHSKRRREERSQKDSAGKKRVKNHADGSKPIDGSRKKGSFAPEGNTAGDIGNRGLEVSLNQNSFKLPNLLKNESLKEQYHGEEERQDEFISLPSTPALDSRTTVEAGVGHEETNDQNCNDVEFQMPLKQIEIMNTAVRKYQSIPGKQGVTIDTGGEVHKTAVTKEQPQSGAKCVTAANSSESNKHVDFTTQEQLEGGVEVRKLFQDLDLLGMPDVLSSVARTTSAVESNNVQTVRVKQKAEMTIMPVCSSPCQSNLVYDDNESPSEAWKSLPKQFLSPSEKLPYASQFSTSPGIGPVKDLGSRNGRTGSRGVKGDSECEHDHAKKLDKSTDYVLNSKSEKSFAPDTKTNKSLSSPGSSGSLIQGSSNSFGPSSPQKSEPQVANGLGNQDQEILNGSASFQQEYSLPSHQQSPVVTNQNVPILPAKENTSPDNQQSIGQKEIVFISAHSSGKFMELSRAKPARSTHQRYHIIAETTHTSIGEKGSDNQLAQDHMEELTPEKSDKIKEQLCSQGSQQFQLNMPKTKGQDQKPCSVQSGSCQHAFPQDNSVYSKLHGTALISTVSSGKVRSTEGESSNVSSLLSPQMLPLHPSSIVNSSLPPSPSCLGFASKTQQSFLKSGSGSPSFEKSGSGAFDIPYQLDVVSKSTSGPCTPLHDKPVTLGPLTPSNEKVSYSSGTKYIPTISGAVSPLNDTKQKAKNNNISEVKKPDSGPTVVNSVTGGAVGGPSWHSTEAGFSSSKLSTKELARNSGNTTNKVMGLGKSSYVSVIPKHLVRPKGHHCILSLNQSGQTSCKQESGFSATISEQAALPQAGQPSLQTRHVMNSTIVKGEKMGGPSVQMGLRSTSVQPLAHLAAAPDKQVSIAAAPMLNDEELALLLHQELNSSPRVPRVARVRQHVTNSQLTTSSPAVCNSIKRPSVVTTPSTSAPNQKENQSASRKRVRDDSSRESSHGSLIGVEDTLKGDTWTNKKHEEMKGHIVGIWDLSDGCTGQKAITMSNTTEASSHHSPLPAIPESQSASDMSAANDSLDAREKKSSADNIVTLPGLIEEILNEKGNEASYDYICDAVSPHWPKLRKQNGERYAYTSHRQAVLDCLRNRSAWSHLIDRGPKTNVGRKKRRHESIATIESENDDDGDAKTSTQDDEVGNCRLGKSFSDPGVDRTEYWASDKVRGIDITLLEEVPKGKRKARRRRRSASQGKGDGSSHRKDENKQKGVAEAAGHIEGQEAMLSPLSEEAGSNVSDEEEILVLRGLRHIRRHGSSVDSGDDIDL